MLKLDATDSTNSYIKDLLRNEHVKNWTIVVADYQTHGKGQFDNEWVSEKGKNLTFSILVKFQNLKTERQFYLNYLVSIAVYNVLRYYIPDKLSVKWPNDILSGQQKICGILIECMLKNDKVKYAVIGIGLNVNQTLFPEAFKATSLKKILKRTIDRDDLLNKIILELQYQFLLIDKQHFSEIKMMYERILFKKGIPSMFVDNDQKAFMGIISGISEAGKLCVTLEDDTIREFDLKEIRFA